MVVRNDVFREGQKAFVLLTVLVLLTVAVAVLALMAYLTLNRGETMTYISPATTAAASEVELWTPRGASDVIPEVAVAAENSVETLAAEEQIIAPVVENAEDITGKPVDPTNVDSPENLLDNLF